MSYFPNSYSFSLPPAAACDPYWGYTSLLLHMDGTDNGTTFTDDGTAKGLKVHLIGQYSL